MEDPNAGGSDATGTETAQAEGTSETTIGGEGDVAAGADTTLNDQGNGEGSDLSVANDPELTLTNPPVLPEAEFVGLGDTVYYADEFGNVFPAIVVHLYDESLGVDAPGSGDTLIGAKTRTVDLQVFKRQHITDVQKALTFEVAGGQGKPYWKARV